MTSHNISLGHLAIGFIPVVWVLYLMWRAEHDVKKAGSALLRMFIQLMLVGYFLLLVFSNPSALLTSSLWLS